MTITGDASILRSAPSAASQQCVRFMLLRPHGEYNENDIANAIVPGYFATCASVGVDPLLMIAQMIHETGNLTSWWSQRPRRNPAGIGVTGRTSPTQPTSGAWQRDDGAGVWKEGVAFPSWKDDSIPAHVGRMLAYTMQDNDATPQQREMIAASLRWRPLPTKFRGVAPTLRGLEGRWAVPGHGYADKIAGIANAISSV